MRRTVARKALLGLCVLSSTAANAGPLPGDGLKSGERACYALAATTGTKLTRLLVELHKEEINPGDPPVIWAGVYGEKQGEARPGFNRDGCSAYEPGDVNQEQPLDHLRCGFSCDGGTLLIKPEGDGIAITPQDLFLRSCGLGEEMAGGFLLNVADLGGSTRMTTVDDAECRSAMAPGEKMIEDQENAID